MSGVDDSENGQKHGEKEPCSYLRLFTITWFCTCVAIPILGLGVTVVTYVFWTGTEGIIYRGVTAVKAVRALSRLSSEDVDNFIKSYEVFTKDTVDLVKKRHPDDKYSIDEQHVINYYKIMTNLAALGEIEKMYVPPLMSEERGIFGNQLEYERSIARKLVSGVNDLEEEHGPSCASNIEDMKKLSDFSVGSLSRSTSGLDAEFLEFEQKSLSKVRFLEIGCGRGRIAHNIASYTGVSVVGLNIAEDQILEAQRHARTNPMAWHNGNSLEFIQRSMNDLPYPFEANTFDGFYHVQAMTYASDVDAILKELYRVLKPGAKLVFCDWFVMDAYNPKNSIHLKLMRRTKALIGAIKTPTVGEYHRALEKAGFVIQESKNLNQLALIQNARDFFMPIGRLVDFLAYVGVLPEYTSLLLRRLNKYVDDCILATEMGLFTMVYEIVAQKPVEVLSNEECHIVEDA